MCINLHLHLILQVVWFLRLHLEQVLYLPQELMLLHQQFQERQYQQILALIIFPQQLNL